MRFVVGGQASSYPIALKGDPNHTLGIQMSLEPLRLGAGEEVHQYFQSLLQVFAPTSDGKTISNLNQVRLLQRHCWCR